MIVSNVALCKTANAINLKLHSFGRAIVNTEWQGYVQNPTVSRLYYIINGSAYISYGQTKVDLCAGNWYLLPANLSFHFNCLSEMEHLYFHITLSGHDEIDLLGSLSNPVFICFA